MSSPEKKKEKKAKLHKLRKTLLFTQSDGPTALTDDFPTQFLPEMVRRIDCDDFSVRPHGFEVNFFFYSRCDEFSNLIGPTLQVRFLRWRYTIWSICASLFFLRMLWQQFLLQYSPTRRPRRQFLLVWLRRHRRAKRPKRHFRIWSTCSKINTSYFIRIC